METEQEFERVHVGDISFLAAMTLEDSRVGISVVSSGYAPMERRDGKYPYYFDRVLYEYVGDGLIFDDVFDLCRSLYEPFTERAPALVPKPEGYTDTAYRRAVHAFVLDNVRYLLPLATLTNVDVVGNVHALEHLIHKLSSVQGDEYEAVKNRIRDGLIHARPAVTRLLRDGAETQRAIRGERAMRRYLPAIVVKHDPRAQRVYPHPECMVRLIRYDPDAEQFIQAMIHFTASQQSFDACYTKPTNHVYSYITRVIEKERALCSVQLPRCFEHATYTFEIVSDIGTYRDLQRHRFASRERQSFSFIHGWEYPILAEPNERAAIDKVFQKLEAAYERMQQLPQAAYLVPLGARVRWVMTVNARELARVVEQGHWALHWIAQEMYRRVKDVHPWIARCMVLTEEKGFATAVAGE